MELNLEQRVWNRAALQREGSGLRQGDSALAALLLAHGMVMNGGVQHALESLSSTELAAAIAGYRFYGLRDVAQLLAETTADELDEDEASDRADATYEEAVPDDGVLFERFHAVFGASPDLFSPV